MIQIKTGLPKIFLYDTDKNKINLLDYKNKNLIFIIAQCVHFEEKEATNLWEEIDLLIKNLEKEVSFFLLPVWDWKDNMNKDDLCPFMSTDLFQKKIKNYNITILEPVNNSNQKERHPIIRWFNSVKEEEYDGESFLDSGEIKDNFIKIFIHKSGVIANKFKSSAITINEIIDIIKVKIKESIVWTQQIDVPYDFIEALWGSEETVENIDENDSTKIIKM